MSMVTLGAVLPTSALLSSVLWHPHWRNVRQASEQFPTRLFVVLLSLSLIAILMI